MSLGNFEIIVGTYEEFLLGYMPKHLLSCEDVYSLTQTFATHDLQASIRCVASNEKMLACGGSDDTIHLYNVGQRRGYGVLMHHNGTVNCVEFSPDGSHLLSGGSDGMLAIYNVENGQLEKVWNNAHKGSAILDICVHPSGKLALSVGSDGTLQTWNLVKGRRAYTSRLGSTKSGIGWQISGVCWNLNGTLYAVGIGMKVDVYCVQSAAIVYSACVGTKVSTFFFLKDNTLLIGGENGFIYVHNVREKSLIWKQMVHDRRVKCMKYIESEGQFYIVTASSDGHIKIWKYEEVGVSELCEVLTGCRITCLTISSCGYPAHFKVKEENEDLSTSLEMVEKLDLLQRHQSTEDIPGSSKRRGFVTVEEEEKEIRSQSCKRKKLNHSSKLLNDVDHCILQNKNKKNHNLETVENSVVDKSLHGGSKLEKYSETTFKNDASQNLLHKKKKKKVNNLETNAKDEVDLNLLHKREENETANDARQNLLCKKKKKKKKVNNLETNVKDEVDLNLLHKMKENETANDASLNLLCKKKKRKITKKQM